MTFHHEKFNDIISKPEELVILCGAGISVPPPSNLMSVEQFNGALAKAAYASSTFEASLIEQTIWGSESHPALRFEQIVTVLMDLDPALTFLDYLKTEVDSPAHPQPNPLHYWICSLMLKGAEVVTTNFDALLELAWLKLTENPEPNCSESPKTTERLHKVHGSIQTIENRQLAAGDKSALKADIFKVSEGTTVEFQVEDNDGLLGLLEHKNLIILGYSFSDSFDVVPILQNAHPKSCVVVEFNPNRDGLKEVTTFLSLPKFEPVESVWCKKGVDIIKLSGNTSLLAKPFGSSISQSSAGTQTISNTFFPGLTAVQLDYILAIMGHNQGLYRVNAKLKVLAEQNEDQTVATFASYYYLATLPEWDLILNNEHLLHEHPVDGNNEISIESKLVTMKTALLMLDGAGFIGDRHRFFRILKITRARLKSYAREADPSDYMLYTGRIYHCIANYFLNTGRPTLALIAIERSLHIREQYGDISDVFYAAATRITVYIHQQQITLATRALENLKRYAAQINNGEVFYNLSLAEGLVHLAQKDYTSAVNKFEAANQYLNEGEEDIQIDPELELYFIVAGIKSDTAKIGLHIRKIHHYVHQHQFEYYKGVFDYLLNRFVSSAPSEKTNSRSPSKIKKMPIVQNKEHMDRFTRRIVSLFFEQPN